MPSPAPMRHALQKLAQTYAAYKTFQHGSLVEHHRRNKGLQTRCDACNTLIREGKPRRVVEVNLYATDPPTFWPQARATLTVCDDPETCTFKTSVRIS